MFELLGQREGKGGDGPTHGSKYATAHTMPAPVWRTTCCPTARAAFPTDAESSESSVVARRRSGGGPLEVEESPGAAPGPSPGLRCSPAARFSASWSQQACGSLVAAAGPGVRGVEEDVVAAGEVVVLEAAAADIVIGVLVVVAVVVSAGVGVLAGQRSSVGCARYVDPYSARRPIYRRGRMARCPAPKRDEGEVRPGAHMPPFVHSTRGGRTPFTSAAAPRRAPQDAADRGRTRGHRRSSALGTLFLDLLRIGVQDAECCCVGPVRDSIGLAVATEAAYHRRVEPHALGRQPRPRGPMCSVRHGAGEDRR